MGAPFKTFVVEHLDPELEAWSALEYQSIAQECVTDDVRFMLSTQIETRGVEEIFAHCKDRICLLDPAASQELRPEDLEHFDVFLFGGILGDDPPRDRTSELRKKGYQGRRLGPVQMTTDTAVRTTRYVVLRKIPLDNIKCVDHPEIQINQHESTQMPFRYIVDEHGRPIMPEGMIELIKQDADKGFGDLL